MKFSASLILLSAVIEISCQKIEYLGELYENEKCEYEAGIYGTCLKITSCVEDYENYRKNLTNLKVCSYGLNISDSKICCRAVRQKQADLINLEDCRDEFLRFRKKGTNFQHYIQAFMEHKISQNSENCMEINKLNEVYQGKEDINLMY